MKAVHTLASLSNLDQLEGALEESKRSPVLFFKHSPTCGISALAYEELSALLARDSFVDAFVIDVLAYRAVSRSVATRLGVRHESPQALLIHDGYVRWSASHFGVTAQAIEAALAAYLPRV